MVDTIKNDNVVDKKREIKYFYQNEDYNLKLIHGDSLEILKRLDEESFDMIFADPPYFLSNDGITCKNGKVSSVNKGDWDRSKGFYENYKFTKEWLSLCRRVMKNNATIWVSGTMHIIYIVGFAMQELGFKILNDIVWYKKNPPPNISCRYFTHSTEIILWAKKDSKSKHYFNYELMKRLNYGRQMKNLWEILPPSTEEKKFGKHPTQKPLALLDRIIKASTKENDLILDPFCGSSTTGVAAVLNNRKYVGIDNNIEYLEISKKRLEDAIKKKENLLFKKNEF
jgi:site-specific DNA-methyltransferase (adenine-specific)